MSSTPTRESTSLAVALPARIGIAERCADYLQLTKPRIAVLALASVAVGYALGSAGTWSWQPLAYALVGIGLVAVSCSVLNQYLERRIDAQMERTASRPLPAGRLSPAEALTFGLAAGLGGLVWLLAFVNGLTAALAMLTLVLYVAVYTPLKRFSSVCTTVGAVPGALPPVLGWTAAGGALDGGAFALFAILFLWQFPHFLAIAWLYRTDYAAAGLKMLPAIKRATGFLAVLYALALLAASLLPAKVALGGNLYALAAVVLGIGYVVAAARFARHASVQTARGLLWSSLVYLPTLLLVLTWDHFRLLR